MQVKINDAILIAAYTVVVLVGICGNTLVVEAVRRKRSMRSTMNLLLVNLAIADLLVLVWCLPGAFLSLTTHPSGRMGDYICKFFTSHRVAGIGMFVSGLTLTLIAVERFKALVRPMETRLRLTKGNVFYAIAAVWTFALVYVMPLFFLERFSEEQQECVTAWPTASYKGTVYWILLAGITTTAFAIMFLCYFSIIKGLYFTNTICSRNAGCENDALFKRRIAKMLLLITVVFALCFFPFVMATATDISPRSSLYKTAYFLVYCSSCLNPIIYAVGSTNYRSAFRELLRDFKFRCIFTRPPCLNP